MSDLHDIYKALKEGDVQAESKADLVQTVTVEASKIEVDESEYLDLCKAPRTEKEAWRIY